MFNKRLVPNEARRIKFNIDGVVVGHSGFSRREGFLWLYKQSYETLLVDLDYHQIIEIGDKLHSFRNYWSPFNNPTPSPMEALHSPIEARKLEQFPIGTKIVVIFGYSSPSDQFFTHAEPVKVLNVLKKISSPVLIG